MLKPMVGFICFTCFCFLSWAGALDAMTRAQALILLTQQFAETPYDQAKSVQDAAIILQNFEREMFSDLPAARFTSYAQINATDSFITDGSSQQLKLQMNHLNGALFDRHRSGRLFRAIVQHGNESILEIFQNLALLEKSILESYGEHRAYFERQIKASPGHILFTRSANFFALESFISRATSQSSPSILSPNATKWVYSSSRLPLRPATIDALLYANKEGHGIDKEAAKEIYREAQVASLNLIRKGILYIQALRAGTADSNFEKSEVQFDQLFRISPGNKSTYLLIIQFPSNESVARVQFPSLAQICRSLFPIRNRSNRL